VMPRVVGDLVVRSRRAAYHAAGENAETGDRPELLARLEQELHAEADAEERPPACDGMPDRLDQAEGGEVRHAGAEGADPRQYDRRSIGDAIGIAGDLGGVAEAFERLLHAPQVAHVVVDDRERPHRVPYTLPFLHT